MESRLLLPVLALPSQRLPGGWRVRAVLPHGEQRIVCGQGEWVRGAAAVHPHDSSMHDLVAATPGEWKIAVSGAWTADSTYMAKQWWHETPFSLTFICHFDGDRLTVKQLGNVGFSSTEFPALQVAAS